MEGCREADIEQCVQRGGFSSPSPEWVPMSVRESGLARGAGEDAMVCSWALHPQRGLSINSGGVFPTCLLSCT